MTDYAMSSLKRRVEVFMNDNYILSANDLIKQIELSNSFLEQFINAILVKDDEMFRDFEFWQTLYLILKNEYADSSEISFWFPDTNSYHEVYSLLIILARLNFIEKSKIQVSSINKLSINTIKSKIITYKDWEEHLTNHKRFDKNEHLEQYFDEIENSYRLKKNLLNNVNVARYNFLTESGIGKYDIILFRNKMLCYNSSLKDIALKKITHSAKHGTLIAIGINEIINYPDWEKDYSVYNKSEKIYIKI